MSSNNEVMEVALDDVIDIMVEKINAGGTVTFTPNGTSMLPMLRDGEDIVMLEKPPEGRLHLFDVPLYKRDSGAYVLHRIIDFDPDGSYVLCGDNQFRKEHGIRDENIIAVMTAFIRKGVVYRPNYFRYRVYVNFWYYTRPFRGLFRLGKRAFRKVFPKTEEEADNKDNSDKE